jgi:fatty-acyl-CoA synthase
LRQGDRELTYAELAARVEQVAGGLAARGVSRGDRVAWLGHNDIATFEVLFAAGRLGAIFVPINTRLARPEVAFQLDDCRPAVLVHGCEPADLVAEIAPSLPELPVLPVTALTDASTETGPPVDVGLADDAVILYTSGTTGRPKGAVLSHGNLTFNTMNQLAHADVLSTDIALCISPLFHATGLGQVSLPTLFKGGTVVVVGKFDAGAVLAAIAAQRITSFSAVPTMLQLMCEHADFAGTDLGSLRYVVYGGSPVAERVAVAWQRRGIVLQQGYGMTEASPGVYLAPSDGAADKPVSVGVEHFFTDVARDGGGELLVRGLNVFRRYWNRPADTEAAFTDGWYRSGDVVRVDDDGWGYVVDRMKDLIISGGENIYPSEVEDAITTLPGIQDAAVVATPDERWGEVGTAFVVVDAAGQWDEASLRAALTGRLAAFKIPKYVRILPNLPRTATGKVRKQQLRERLGEQQ